MPSSRNSRHGDGLHGSFLAQQQQQQQQQLMRGCPLLQAVVLTDASLEDAKRVDAFCHANGIAFIYVKTRGVFATVFTDFGPNFTVIDVDGACGLDKIWGARAVLC